MVTQTMGPSFGLGFDRFNHQFLAKRVAPGSVVYDVGANAGQMALLFSRLVGSTGRVYSFEPVPQLCRTLERNLALNGIDNVTVFPFALGSEEKEVTFSFHTHNPTTGKIVDIASSTAQEQSDTAGGELLTVQVRRLDQIVQETRHAPTVLKIDVEGAGAEVLRGAAHTLKTHRPLVFMEFHNDVEQLGAKELISMGYRAETADGHTVLDPTAAWYNPLWFSPQPLHGTDPLEMP